MALGVRGEIRRSQQEHFPLYHIFHYTTLCWGARRVSLKGVRTSLCPYSFKNGKGPPPKNIGTSYVVLATSTVEGISSGIRGTLGGRKGGFPTGSEQQVPEASNLGYRPTRQTASYAPVILLLISRQPLLFHTLFVDGSTFLLLYPAML